MIRNAVQVPIWLARSTGFRPMLSERRPRIGPEISWQKAYDAIKRPTVVGDPPKCSV